MTANRPGHTHGTPPARDSTDPHAGLHHDSPERAEQAGIAALRDHGERVTDARRAVLGVLARTHEHVSADHVVALLEHGDPRVHRATVYRTLEVLAERGIVSSLHTAGGATAYHLATPAPGHEHLHAYCRVCGDVVVIPADCLDEAVREVTRVSGLTIDPQQSTLIGVCARCAEAAAAGRGHAVTPAGRTESS